MNGPADEVEPKLAPPGAGLPPLELAIARCLFAWKRLTTGRRAFQAKFDDERSRIASLVTGVDAESGSRRVLIERVRGLEDSSRYWSVWMTIDHLRIVNEAIARVIGALVGGIIPPGVVSTADVKPNASVGPEMIAGYEAACDHLVAVVKASPNLKTTLRYPHPWFGPLDAAAWHALSGGHMGIHREQLERILAGLRG
jgi:hypothetical protein